MTKLWYKNFSTLFKTYQDLIMFKIKTGKVLRKLKSKCK